MKIKIASLLIVIVVISCSGNKENNKHKSSSIEGTWKLLRGIVVENGNTTVTDYTQNISFIKIINGTHFAFLQHDLNKGQDSSAIFVAGGGSYSLSDSLYTEHLEYCSARNWEGNDFKFTISIKADTLTQKGIEKIEEQGINRLNIERYVRIK